MFDLIPNLFDLADNLAIWVASGAAGFYAHKRVSIDYKQRWKDAIQLLKDEKLQTEQLELAAPKKKPSGHFASAGNPKEFRSLLISERVTLEKERLNNGLPPKDSLVGTSSYDIVAKERIKHGWDFDIDDNGWYWHPTTTHAKQKTTTEDAIKKAYDLGRAEARNSISNHYDHYSDFYRDASTRYKELQKSYNRYRRRAPRY
jgi:hypothetical protein